MKNVNEALAFLQTIDGFIGAALVDSDSGMAAGTLGGNADFNIDIAAATNSDVYRAKLRAANELGLKDGVQDILITLSTQFHLLSPLPAHPSLFFYLALRRDQANLAMARIKLGQAAKEVTL